MNERVLIDASNLHTGGGVQVAATFISDLSSLVDGPPWVEDLRIELSSAVEANLAPAARRRLTNRTVVDRSVWTGRRWLPGQRFAVTFAVFGPEYGWRRGRRTIAGFADGLLLWPQPLGLPRAGPWTRFRRSVRRRVARRLFGQADLLIVESERAKLELAATLGRQTSSIAVVPNAVNPVFLAGPTKDPVATLDKGLRIAYVARAYPHKNHGFLGRVARAWKGPPLTFVLTLSEDEWNRMDQLTREAAENAGVQQLASLPDLLRSCDALIFPSLLETYSATPLEAMAVGLPVFAADRDYVRDHCGDAPIYFDPLDPLDFVAALKRCLADPQLLQDAARRGRDHVQALPNSMSRTRSYVALIDRELHRSVVHEPE